MSVIQSYIEHFGDPRDAVLAGSSGPASNWQELCACGHVHRNHAKSSGGAFTSPDGVTSGCYGAAPSAAQRTLDQRMVRKTRDDGSVYLALEPTCPCRTFNPVAEVDRPGRYFHQRIPRDGRHPFPLGMRAYFTRILKFKDVNGDPDLAAAEFDRRFRWLDGQPTCAKCGAHSTPKQDRDDIWPRFVIDSGHQSAMRCDKCGDRA